MFGEFTGKCWTLLWFKLNPYLTLRFITSSLNFTPPQSCRKTLIPTLCFWSHESQQIFFAKMGHPPNCGSKCLFSWRDYIEDGDGRWRRNVLVTIIRFWWRSWPFWSPILVSILTYQFFYIRAEHQHSNDATNILKLSLTARCHRNLVIISYRWKWGCCRLIFDVGDWVRCCYR